MTERLYQSNVYLKECMSTILAISEESCLILDRSPFFPISGGQPCDLGTINDIQLSEVFEKDGELYHKFSISGSRSATSPQTEDPKVLPFRIGDTVICRLDWERRFDHMQRHCGEHILSGVFFRDFGGVNRGFHMGSDYMTIDIDLPAVTIDMAHRAELSANEVIWSDAPVSIRYFQSREEAERLPLRKGISIEKDISIVCVGDEASLIDCVACCGTHPKTAGQIGLIKLLKIEKYKGMSRIYFEAGKRAFLKTVKEHKLIATLAEKYSADENTLTVKISAQEEKNQLVRQDLQKYQVLLIEREVQSLIEAISFPGEDSPGCRQVIVKEYDRLNLEDLQLLAKGISALSPNIFILISIEEKALLISRANQSNSSSPDCGGLIKSNVGDFKGKGGGSPLNGRASFQSSADLDDFVLHVVGLMIDEI